MEGMSIFNQVNSHQQYKQDPFGTISTHIENKMLIEATSIEWSNPLIVFSTILWYKLETEKCEVYALVHLFLYLPQWSKNILSDISKK